MAMGVDSGFVSKLQASMLQNVFGSGIRHYDSHLRLIRVHERHLTHYFPTAILTILMNGWLFLLVNVCECAC